MKQSELRCSAMLLGLGLFVALGCTKDDRAEASQPRATPPAEKPAAEPMRVQTPMNPARQKAPDFELALIDGTPIRLSELEGQVVLIDFWATWCGPCRMSIPHLVELQTELAERSFTVLGISLDRTGSDGVASFASRLGINYPVAMGTGEVQRAYGGVPSIPTAFLVDREGYVVRMFRGYQPKDVLKKEILPLLEG